MRNSRTAPWDASGRTTLFTVNPISLKISVRGILTPQTVDVPVGQQVSVVKGGQVPVTVVVATQLLYEHVAVSKVHVPDGPMPGSVVTCVGQLRDCIPVTVLTT